VRSTNFCVYSFSVRPHASKIMVRFYRAEFSHSLGPRLPSPTAAGQARKLSGDKLPPTPPPRSALRPARELVNCRHGICTSECAEEIRHVGTADLGELLENLPRGHHRALCCSFSELGEAGPPIPETAVISPFSPLGQPAAGEARRHWRQSRREAPVYGRCSDCRAPPPRVLAPAV
jgi:hypothetical protein